MTMQTETLSLAAFLRQHRPLPNILNPNAPEGGCMYETFGPEFDHVRNADPANVWTLCAEGDSWFVAYGFHLVNRMGYFLTRDPMIDAAPHLLDALRELVAREQAEAASCGFTDDEMTWLEDARRAIAKAQGD